MLDREGAAEPKDVSIVGDEDHVAATVRHLADIGVTDFVAVEFLRDEVERQATRDVLRSFV